MVRVGTEPSGMGGFGANYPGKQTYLTEEVALSCMMVQGIFVKSRMRDFTKIP